MAPCLAKNNSDWVNAPTHKNLCGGYYQEPIYPYPCITPKAEAELPFELSADSTEFQAQGVSRFQGNVSLRQGNKHLQADNILLSRKANEIQSIEAHSNILFTQPDIRIEGKTGFWDHIKQTLLLDIVDYRYYPRQARGHAQKVIVSKAGQLKLTKASYTTCAPQSNTWMLNAQTMTLDKTTGRGQGRDITLRIKDVPVFYWPYLDFPIDSKRHSGFLAPHIASTSNSGMELALPFYWNLAPNYDYILTPQLLSDRGVNLQNHLRYLTPHATGHVQFDLLPHDEKRDISRLKLNVKHDHRFCKTLKGDIDFNYVGDDNYFIDLEQDLNDASITKLLQQVGLSYANLNWEHMLRLQQYQVLHPTDGPISQDDYRRQPQWAFHALYPKKIGGLTAELDGEFTHFTHSHAPLGNTLTTGQRYHLRPALSLPIEHTAGYFTPRIQLDLLDYNLQLSDADIALNRSNQFARAIPLFDVNTGLVFEKIINAPGKTRFKQTLEPQIYYLYVPFVDQQTYPNFDSGIINFSYSQEFRDNRFSGRDRVGDTNQMTLALTSRLYDVHNQELVRANIGEIFYFADRKTTLYTPFEDNTLLAAHSDLAANIAIYPNERWSFSYGIEWNPGLQETDKSFLSAQYQPGRGKVLNLNYYWMKRDPAQTDFTTGISQPLNQIDASFTWPVHLRLNLLAQIHYDFQEQRVITMLAGLEHQSCCMAYQLVSSRYLKPNDGISPMGYTNGLFFQIMFKGLTTLSLDRADSKLAKAIPGYSPFAKQTLRTTQNMI